jgi:WD40 repeat protein
MTSSILSHWPKFFSKRQGRTRNHIRPFHSLGCGLPLLGNIQCYLGCAARFVVCLLFVFCRIAVAQLDGEPPAPKEPERIVETEHTGKITALAYSPDGKYLASAGTDGAVKLRDARDGRVLRTFWHDAQVNSVVFAPDGCCIASSSNDQTIRIWTISDGREYKRFQTQQWATHIIFSNDGKTLLAGRPTLEGVVIELWDMESGKVMKRLTAKIGGLRSLALSHDGHLLAMGSDGTEDAPAKPNQIGLKLGLVQILDLSKGEPIRTLRGHEAQVSSIAFCPDGKRIASGDSLGNLKLWDLSTGAEQRSVDLGGPIQALIFTPDAAQLIVRSTGLMTVDPETGSRQREFDAELGDVIAVTTDGTRLASAGTRSLRLFNVNDPSGKPEIERRMLSNQTDIWFTPVGDVMLTADDMGYVRVWDLRKGTMHSLESQHWIGQYVDQIASRDGTLITGWGQGTSVYSYDSTGKSVREIDGWQGAASSDGKLLATRTYDDVTLWELPTFRKLLSFPLQNEANSSIAISEDHQWLGVTSNDGARFYSLVSGKKASEYVEENSFVNHLAFSPDGRSVALATTSEIVIFDLKKKRAGRPITIGTGFIESMAFSPDGRTLAIGRNKTGPPVSDGGEGTLVLLDVASRKVTQTLGTGNVHTVAFSRNGRIVFAASPDGTIRLWSPDNGVLIATILALALSPLDYGHSYTPEWVMVTDDGRWGGTSSAFPAVSVRKAGESMSTVIAAEPHPELLATVIAASGRYKPHVVSLSSVTETQSPCKVQSSVKTYPEVVPQFGHAAPVYSLAIGPSARWFASGASDSTIKFWTPSGMQLRTIFADQGFLSGLAISPDGKQIASSGERNGVKLWDTRTGVLLRALQAQHEAVFGVAFSPDGRLLASSSADRTLSLWDVRTGEEVQTLASDPAEPLFRVSFSPDGQLVAVAAEKHVYTWSVATGKQLLALPVEDISQSAVVAVTFSADGKWLAAGQGNHVRIWAMPAGKEATEIPSSETVNGVEFSPDSQRLAISGNDKVHLFSLRGELIREYPGHGGANTVRFALDGTALFAATAQGVWGWDTVSGNQIFAGANAATRLVGAGFVNMGQIFVLATATGQLVKWEAQGISPPDVFRMVVNKSPSPEDAVYVGSIIFDPTRPWTFAALTDGSILIWDLQGAKAANTIPPPQIDSPMQMARMLSMAPDGSRVVATDINNDIDLYKIENRHLLHSFSSGKGPVWAINFDGSGKQIFAASDKSIVFYDVDTGDIVRTLIGHSSRIDALAASPDGHWIASGDENGIVRLWDATSGRPTFSIPGHCNQATSVAFHPDSKLLASAGTDGIVRVWEIPNGHQDHVLTGAPGAISKISFSPTGRFLIADSVEGAAVIWDVASGKLLARVYVADDENNWLVTTPGGAVDGSPGATSKLIWRMSASLSDIRADEHQPSLHPGLLQSVLNTPHE